MRTMTSLVLAPVVVLTERLLYMEEPRDSHKS